MERCRHCDSEIKLLSLRGGAQMWAHTTTNRPPSGEGFHHRAEPAGAPDLRDVEKLEEWLEA